MSPRKVSSPVLLFLVVSAGNDALQNGKYIEAAKHYTDAIMRSIESRPFTSIFLCNRAAAHQHLGNVIDAIKDCNLAIALDWDHMKAISRRAGLHEKIRDYEHASLDMERLISLQEKRSEKKYVKDLKDSRERLSSLKKNMEKGMSMDLYMILGLKRSESNGSEIKKAYDKAARSPDEAGKFLEISENGVDGHIWKEIKKTIQTDDDKLFKKIKEAYAVLSDSKKSTEFSTNDYAVLVAHPASFRKFPEPFLCLIRMSRNYTLDEDTYPTFLRDDGTEMDLLAFIQVADPTKVKVGERERDKEEARILDSIEDTSTGLVTRVKVIVAENVTAEKPKRPRKKRKAVTDASGSSHPPKKLRGMLNVEAGVAAVATLPIVTSSVSSTPEHESGAPADSITGLNLHTIGASERSAVVPPVMTEAMVTSHAVTVLLVSETGTKDKDEEIENLKAQLLLKETEAAKAAHLRAQVSAVEATKKIHTNEIDALNKRSASLENEKESLDGKFVELQSSISTKDLELKDLNVVVSSLRSQKDGLVDQVHAPKTTSFSLCDQVLGYERLKEQIKEFQDVQMNVVNDKVAKLDADLLEIAFHLEEKFYPHFLTTISGRRWLSTHNLKLAVVKCLNSQEYLSALGAAISRIEKGMQNGLSTNIDHGKAGRSLADVVAYNPAAKADITPPFKGFARENVEAKRSALIGVWTPLVDPLFVENLVGESGTSDSVPTIIATTTALSTTFASASSIPLITIEDYEIVCTGGSKDALGSGQGNVASFPTVEFEKEELDITPERDLPS
nr:DnaJ domain, zinc finger, CCHC-type, tetratricopeptide-like helical domain protein [Tanacetum cinerariifolium]